MRPLPYFFKVCAPGVSAALVLAAGWGHAASDNSGTDPRKLYDSSIKGVEDEPALTHLATLYKENFYPIEAFVIE